MAMNTLEIPALGRQFELGCLYDKRREQLYPGMFLWDKKHIDDMTNSTQQDRHWFDLLSEDNLAESYKAVGLEGTVLINCLLDMFEVKGSAKFIHEKHALGNVSSVVFKCCSIMRYDQLNMNHMKQLPRTKVLKEDVLEETSATHVISAIEYGVQGFLILESSLDALTNKKEVQAQLSGMVHSELTGTSFYSYQYLDI